MSSRSSRASTPPYLSYVNDDAQQLAKAGVDLPSVQQEARSHASAISPRPLSRGEVPPFKHIPNRNHYLQNVSEDSPAAYTNKELELSDADDNDAPPPLSDNPSSTGNMSKFMRAVKRLRNTHMATRRRKDAGVIFNLCVFHNFGSIYCSYLSGRRGRLQRNQAIGIQERYSSRCHEPRPLQFGEAAR